MGVRGGGDLRGLGVRGGGGGGRPEIDGCKRGRGRDLRGLGVRGGGGRGREREAAGLTELLKSRKLPG